MARMPVLFVGHGSPMNALEDNEFSRAWIDAARALPRPKVVLCVSAHWETPGVAVISSPAPETIHDFYGFPRELFEVRYPAPGDAGLAARVAALLAPEPVALDPRRGLDHGAWSVLVQMYPEAGIPVVQLSLDTRQPPAFHLDLARRLRPLRDEGVLVLGSGDIVHNLGIFQYQRPDGFDWAERFNAAAKRQLLAGELAPLLSPETLDPDGALAVPTPEHYLPMLYAAALRDPGEPLTFFADRVVMGSISMTSFRIG